MQIIDTLSYESEGLLHSNKRLKNLTYGVIHDHEQKNFDLQKDKQQNFSPQFEDNEFAFTQDQSSGILVTNQQSQQILAKEYNSQSTVFQANNSDPPSTIKRYLLTP